MTIPHVRADQYILFCSRPFLFFNVESAPSAARGADHGPQRQPRSVPSHAQISKQAVVDVTRGLQHDVAHGDHVLCSDNQAHSAPSNANASFSPQKKAARGITRDAATSTGSSAVFQYAAMLERFAAQALAPQALIPLFKLSRQLFPILYQKCKCAASAHDSQ
jgi:hypothetical protein